MVNGRKALELLWKDHCTVTVREEQTNPATKITGFSDVVKVQNQPCKLSFETLSAAGGDNVATVSQAVKLFLASEIQIPPGSKLSVTRPSGDVMHYQKSGLAGVFSNHQEITLVPFKGWA